MQGTPAHYSLERGELVRVVYRLGRHDASGALTITPRAPGARAELFVLRRGLAITSGTLELERKTLGARLARLASQDVRAVFEGGVSGLQPPGAVHGVSLAAWARAHLEAQLDSSLAEALVRELAGIRLTLRAELAPEPHDEADRRMLAAMAQPRRLDQIWPLARTPRFRLLAFVHFLRAVEALEVEGVGAERARAQPAPSRASSPAFAPPRESPLEATRRAALRVLGIEAAHATDAEQVKRAYRRLARALHPDLQPELDAERRRLLERRFAEVTTAYEALMR